MHSVQHRAMERAAAMDVLWVLPASYHFFLLSNALLMISSYSVPSWCLLGFSLSCSNDFHTWSLTLAYWSAVPVQFAPSGSGNRNTLFPACAARITRRLFRWSSRYAFRNTKRLSTYPDTQYMMCIVSTIHDIACLTNLIISRSKSNQIQSVTDRMLDTKFVWAIGPFL